MQRSPSPSDEDSRRFAGPVFVGGAMPRSGTHAVSHLIGCHSRYLLIAKEIVLHCLPMGIPGFVEGRVSREQLIEDIRTVLWNRHNRVGLFGVVDRDLLEASISAFASGPDDPLEASRVLLSSLLDPLAERAGKPSWVEKTLSSVMRAPLLLSLFPGAKFVHVVRDGRDAACSVARMPWTQGTPWGRDSPPDTVRRWARRLRMAEAAMRSVPSDRFLVLYLEDLILLERERTYARLLDFLEAEDESEMKVRFDLELTPRRAHIGRWRTELEAPVRREMLDVYREVLHELHADGISCAPPERSLEASFAPDPADAANPVDPWSRHTAGT